MIRWLEKNRYVAIILTILIALLIFLFSSIPGTAKIPGVKVFEINWMAILYHFVIFFLFSFFLLISIKGNKKIKRSYVIIALIISVAYAFLDEFHQMFVPFRDSTIQDVLTNAIGTFSSAIIYLFYSKKNFI